jgi:uncharacterized protein
MFDFIWRLPRRIAQAMIVLYQKTLSPDHSWISRVIRMRACRYTPTCSEYTHDAIGKYGIIKGSLMGAWRIARCNPWSRGGYDPVR